MTICRPVATPGPGLVPWALGVKGSEQMARVTVEDCLAHVENRFALVILAAARARQLAKKAPPLVPSRNRPAVTALREIAVGRVRPRVSVRQLVDEAIREQQRR